MITQEQAEAAQTKLLESLASPPWLLGLGLVMDAEGSWGLKILASPASEGVLIPTLFEGVPVQVRLVEGTIKAQ